MKRLLLLLVCSLWYTFQASASCTSGYSEVIVSIIPDNYPTEISWSITDSAGAVIAMGDSIGDTLCIPLNSCHLFTIYDSFGDGIITPGGFWLYVDGVEVATGSNFGFQTQYSLNCPPGMFCTSPLTITAGSYTAPFDDTWYIYTPTVSGTYNITTCNNNTCDTKIWVYSTCPTTPYPEGPPGTYAFNDDNNCGTQANLNVVMVANSTYFIRIGDNIDLCTGSINFDLAYVGPIAGCMDPNGCNYNPLATIDDGSCIYNGNPGCAGPDLQLDSMAFLNSLSIQSQSAGICDIDEGCVTGYGTRYVVTFTSKINNIGSLDFYIGDPGSNPGMFNTNNCHGHAHYEGYGDYRLFDSNGNLVPAGHKNGFCVMDLCGFGQYNCSMMGISTGCYDAYGAGTQCQWLDITDVPEGDYRVVAIINSHHLPDAMGHYETNYLNNALQVCMHISRNGGIPSYTLLPNCTPYVDCSGVPGGTSELDCSGVCNGPGVYGDTYSDGTLDAGDIDTYLDIIQSNMPPSSCYDLNADGDISAIDAALINWCMHGNNAHPGGSYHNHCNFPRNIVNPNDMVGISIADVNYTDNYVDVAIQNPSAKIKAFQFTMSGITISSVVSLADPLLFPVDVRYIPSTNEVIGISIQDSSLERSSNQSLVRIYFSAVTDTSICISAVQDLINQDAEQTMHDLHDNCRPALNTGLASIFKPADLVIIPNPANDKAFLHLSSAEKDIKEVTITDGSGRTIAVPVHSVRDSWYEMDLSNLSGGVYILTVRSSETYGVTRFVKL